MAVNETSMYLKYANLQMAAEALFGVPATSSTPVGTAAAPELDADVLMAGNDHASKFPSTLATQFAADWEVVAHQPNTATGFSGTLFRCKTTDLSRGLTTGELVLSFRSTEFIDDAVRDNQATNKLEIKEKGWAFGQIADMEAWYAELRQSGQIDRPVTVTGYSLGGHLATAFNLIRRELSESADVTATYTFNGAGVGQITNRAARLYDLVNNFRRQSVNADGQQIGFADTAINAAYQTLRSSLTGGNAPTSADYALVENAVGAAADRQLLREALTRISTIVGEVNRVAGLTDTSGTPAQVPAGNIKATRLDYQVAVLLAARHTAGYRTDVLSGLEDAYGARHLGPNPIGNLFEIVGATPPSAVANSQLHYGATVPVFIEDQPLFRGSVVTDALAASVDSYFDTKLLVDNYSANDFGDTHSLVLIVDSLAVMDTFAQLDPTLSLQSLSTIFSAASASKAQTLGSSQGKAEGDVLENLLNSLSKTILGAIAPAPLTPKLDGNTWADIADRNAFYASLKTLTDDPGFKALKGKVGVAVSNASLGAAARTDFASLLALLTLSPVAIKATAGNETVVKDALATHWGDEYTAWQADQSLTPEQRQQGHGTYTDLYLADRAAMLSWVVKAQTENTAFDTMNLNVSAPANQLQGGAWAFEDKSSGKSVFVSPGDWNVINPDLHKIAFGSSGSDSLTGTNYADHLYGGAGNDTLQGNGGDDYLEGNADDDLLDGGEDDDMLLGGKGNDTLDGGDDDDTLVGGEGDDTLRGGKGFDTYRYRLGDGKDTIIETREGDRVGGRIVIERGPEIDMLAELLVKQGDQNLWSSADGSITLSHNSPWTLTLADGSSIQLGENQDDFESGDFGLRLYEEKAAPTAFDLTILGDLQPVDFDPVRDGIQTLTDELGNVRVDPDKPEPDREDVLYDSAGNDEIKGLGGVDFIFANRGGLDRIDAGDGNDFVWGGAGGDTVIGGTGADILHGGIDSDRIFGESETTLDAALAKQDDPGSGLTGDLLNGVAGDDTLIGATGNDFLAGGTDDDLMIGGAGDDNLYGDTDGVSTGLDWTATRSVTSSGNTTFYNLITDFYYVVAHDGGNDVIYAGGGDDWLFANYGDDYCDGGTGNDLLFGDLGNDDLFGGEGDDSIIGDDIYYAESLHGDDYLDGEAGNDRLFGQGGDDFLFGGAGTDMLAGHTGDDYLDGEGDTDRLFGGAGDDQLFGGDGNDVLQGDDADRAGDDTLDGEAGDDQLFGMGGRDELHGGEGADQIAGDNGGTNTSGAADAIYGGAGNDWIDAQAGDDIVDAGADNDIVAGRAGNDQLAGGAGNDQLQGGEGNDTLDGGGDSDVLFGQAGNDTLRGGDGIDYLLGGYGNDILDGGTGNDVYYYTMGEGNDHIVDSGGTDWLVFNDINLAGITLGVGSLKLTVPGGEIHLDDFDPDSPYSAGGIEYFAFADGSSMSKAQLINALGFKPIGTPEADELSGTALNDTITALAGNDVVNARAGNDAIYLDAGDDFADAGSGNDSVYGGDGADQVFGGEGGDTIYGGIGDDVLFGDAGNDQLFGDAGNDVLSGGAGSDQLDGGEGDDVFIFARGDGADVVADGAGNNQVQLGSGLIADDVVFTHQDSDLVMAVKNTNDRLTVRHWFAADNHFTGLTLGDGAALDHAGVEALMPRNQAPLLTVDAGTVIEDSLFTVSGNVLSNDADPEGRSLRVTNAGTYAGSVGSLSLGSTGNFSYTLANGSAAVQSLAAGQVLAESFAYTATDDDPNGAASAQSTIVIAVQGTNDLPILGADTGATSEDATAPLTGNVLANDHDVDQGTILAVANPGARVGTYGSLTLAADGAYRYQLNAASTPVQSLAAGQSVTDSFTLAISDGVAAVAGNLAITINGQNDAPILATPLLDQLVSPNTSWSWQLPAASFTDVDAGDLLAYSASLADGSVLPSWLSFSAETQTFSGRAPKSASGAIEISVGVADRLGAKVTDSFTLMVDTASGGGGTGGNGGGGSGDNGGGSLANEGVGNGIDAPPPGHELSFNDGVGTGPGEPGAMGGNGYRPKSRSELTMTDVHISAPIDAPPVVSMTHGHSANAPGQMPSSREEGSSKVRLAAGTSIDEVLVPNTEIVADAETGTPAADDLAATGTDDPLAAWLDALSPRSAAEAPSANGQANGPAYAWGMIDAALLTHLATADDDGAVLNPAGRPSLGQPFLATAEDPLALLAANASLQQFTGLKEGLGKLA